MKKLAMILAFTLVPTFATNVSASTYTSVMETRTHSEPTRDNVFEVKNIKDNTVTVKFYGGIGFDGGVEPINDTIKIPLKKFPNMDVKVGDRFLIVYVFDYSSKGGYSEEFKKPIYIEKMITDKAFAVGKAEDLTVVVNGESYKLSKYNAKGYGDPNKTKYLKVENKPTYLEYWMGEEEGVITVAYPISSAIFLKEDYPKDKIPAEVYNDEFKILSVDEKNGQAKMEVIDDKKKGSQLTKSYKYQAKLPSYQKGSLKANDKIRLWIDLPREGGQEFVDLKAYKYEKIEEEKKAPVVKDIEDKAPVEVENKSSKEKLAKSTFDTLVQVNAAQILLDQSPKTVKNIEGSLRETVEKSEGLINRAFKAILGKNELAEKDKDEAIIEMMRLNFEKKIETENQKKLALSIYKNQITSNAGKTLLEKTPNIVRNIEETLRANVEKSEVLLEKSMSALK